MKAVREQRGLDARRALLEKGALAAGNQWVKRTQAQLTLEGRPVEGGWPGTMSEARGLAAGMSASLKSALTLDESAWVAKAIYAHAKRAWFAYGEVSAWASK